MGCSFIWSEKNAFTVELLKYLENLLYPRLGLSFPPLISCLNIYLSSNSVQVWSALQINFKTLQKPDRQSLESKSSVCTSLPFPLMSNDGSSYITWLGLMLWLTTSNLCSAPRLSWNCEIDMVRFEWSRWWGNSQRWSWVAHSERVCIHCHPGFSWRLNQAGHSLETILQKQTLVGPCLLRPVQLPLCLTPLNLLPTFQMHLFGCLYF